MTRTTFSTLPVEIHDSIAQHCEANELFNLCRTSKWAHERFLHSLYRHVDLNRPVDLDLHVELNRYRSGSDLLSPVQEYYQMLGAFKKQQLFVHTLLSHPEYGRHIRFFKGVLCRQNLELCYILENNAITDEKLWSAMKSLTRVEKVEIGTRADGIYTLAVLSTQIPSRLFQSVTSVTLVGQMQYGLAKSILSAVNPAALQYLCLDLVQDRHTGLFEFGAGDRVENGRIIARGATTGLLTTIRGPCTALQTLILRRLGESQDLCCWHAGAEEASYTEWAKFIRSVRGTLQKFLFEQAEKVKNGTKVATENLPFRIMDERFAQLLLPTLLSGNWPCLTAMELCGVRGSKDNGGTAGLVMGLRAAHSETTSIIVTELAHHFVPFYAH